MDGNGRSYKDTSDRKLGSGDSGEGLGDQGLGEKERRTYLIAYTLVLCGFYYTWE